MLNSHFLSIVRITCMCFNAEVSIITYIVGLVGCIGLYQLGRLPEAIIFGWVIHMQLIEYLLWKNQPCSNNDTQSNTTQVNKLISKVGIFANNLQPIILWLAIVFVGTRSLPQYMHALMIVFSLATILYIKAVFYTTECTTVTEESKPHLHWKWNYGPYAVLYYVFFLVCIAMLSYFGLQDGKFVSIIIVVSFLISTLIYQDKHANGAMWCFMAAFIPWMLVLRSNLH